ncbi:MAG TPA: hypothetical protein VMT86_10685 [Bryobacteraceae bacterium]|nr:hypothetical protein [Bryobacteraceae bacterium]
MPRWRHPLPWLSLLLFSLNVSIAWRMFHVEYLANMGTTEGVFVAYARYARDHWPDLGWCRFWYAGLPFGNVYPPGLHLTAAAVSHFADISAAMAFHVVVAVLYCLGPVTLFWMAVRLTHLVCWSFYAGLLYSLVSPSAFLVPEIRRDLGSLLWAQRLHTPVSYGDSPHVSSLTLIPLAILALDLARERRKPIYIVGAALALASVPLTNWPGAIVLAFAVVAYGLSFSRRDWLVIGAAAFLGYAFAVPWIPPSAVIVTQANTQGFLPVNRFAPHHLVYAAILALSTWVLLRVTARLPVYLRFFLLFTFYMAAVTLGWYWLGLTLIAQPNRFHLAMEMGITLSLTFGLRRFITRWKTLRQVFVVAFAALCVFQFVNYRAYAYRLIHGIDITQTSEYKTARWFDQHMRESRAMVPGSTTFWLNAFTDTPQLTGCCLQSLVNQIEPIANYGITTDLTAEDRAFDASMLWFKALGVRAVAVSGPHSTEVYKPFYHPYKFDGRLPELWRDGDDVIFGVPWRYYSIAHALAPGDLVQRTPIHGVDTAPLIPYVAAINRPDAPDLQVRWLNNETIQITGDLKPRQIVSVQENAHPGWHATVNGTPRRVFADKLGLLAVVPDCSGACTIELHYDGGTEMTVAKWINRAAILGSLVWIILGMRTRRVPSP